MILLDTSGLLAAIDSSQRHHSATVAVLRRLGGPFLLSPFVLAELDHLLATRVSQAAASALLAQVGDGAYRLEPMDASDIDAARRILDRFGDLEIGLADASVVVLAERHDCRDILTLDERHFRTLRASRNRRFRLLPADA